ncbi:MAG: DUF2914 domain-containing protein [Pseudomonadota bacterium]
MLADSFDKGRTMANDKKTIPTFNHIENSAPEYVEVILWRRVVLALGTLVLALGGIGFLLFGWMQESGGNGEMEVVTLPVETISPDQLAPTAAIPTQDDTGSDNPSSITADQSSIAGDSAQPVPAQAEEKSAIAATATSLAPTASDTQPDTQLALLEQSKPAIKKVQTALQPETTGNRHQVQTDILMPAVKRAVLTTVMRGREPGKPLQSTTGLSLTSPLSLHQFVELKGRAGDTLTYTWKRDGKVVTRVQVNVGGDQWRTFGSKAIHGHQQGQWEVDVTDNRNRLLVRSRFYLGA